MIVENSEPAGYCFLMQYKKRQAYEGSAELSVYVRPGFTGRGIGLRAIGRLEAAADAAGIHMLVGTIYRENQTSIRLMEKAGY